MNKIIKNLILIFSLISINLLNLAECAVLTSAQLNKTVYENVYKEISSSVKKYSDDFKINITGIPKEDFKTNDNFIPKVQIISQNNSSNGKFQSQAFKRVLIKDSSNNTIRAFPINIQTKVYKNVLTAKENITYGKEIKLNDLTFERKEVSNCLDKVLTDYKKEYTAGRNFPKGSIITTNYLKEKAAVIKNSVVDITFISKGIKISLQGKALKDGAIGENIPVRSSKYNKIYTGKVNSENEVIVRI